MQKCSYTKLLTLLMLVVVMVLGSCQTTGTQSSNTGSTASEVSEIVEYDDYGRVLIKDNVPTNLDFGGEDVTILVRQGEMFELEFYAEELSNTIINDAIYNRNSEIEDRLNVKIKTLVHTPTSGSYAPVDFNGRLQVDINSGRTDYDLIASYGYYGVVLGNEGWFRNLYDINYLDLKKPWWNQDFINEMTVNNKLYFVIGDASFTSIDYTTGTFFNTKLVEEMIGENLYDVVDRGEWTIDYLSELVKTLYKDDGNGNRDDEDFYGIGMATASMPLDALFTGFGLSITEKKSDNNHVLNFYNNDTISFFDKMYDMLFTNPGVLAGQYTGESIDLMRERFVAQKSVFHIDSLNAIENLRDVNFSYGLLPIPKLSKEQKEYYTCSADIYSILSVPNCLDNSRLPMVGATLELLAAESYRSVTPAYFEVIMKKRYFETEDDARMYDILLGGARYNFGVVNSISLNDIQHLVRTVLDERSKDFTSAYQAKEEAVKQKLDELLEFYNK
ncbi:MAG: extracellular solute-binding protein [Eubacteriales bacterium]|nr:extracellular solute-binding protein [Eubacteriales bacterium]MDD4475763.1 extracellular solute-binding protein [Eubacteriales bacterium]